MPSSECEKIDDKIDQAPETDSYHTTEKRWSRVLLPGPDSPPISPNNETPFDTVTVNTELEASTVKYQEQGIQCDFEEQEEKEKSCRPRMKKAYQPGQDWQFCFFALVQPFFLQALVNPSAIVFGVHGRITKVAGHDYYCHSHSSHHGTLPLHRRRRLVWLRIFLTSCAFQLF